MKRLAEITLFAWIAASFGAALVTGTWWWAIPSGIVVGLLSWGYVMEGKTNDR